MTDQHARSMAGFTLLEILVGLAISSLILLGVSLATKNINLSYARTTDTIGRQAVLTTGLDIFSGDVSRIERVFDNPSTPHRFQFQGSASEAIYIISERPGNAAAGTYFVRLLVRPSSDGHELVRFRTPYQQGAVDFKSLEWSDPVVLLHGGFSIALAYRSSRAGLRDWAGTWEAQTMLPGQVKIEIADQATSRLRVPVLVETLKLDAESSCANASNPDCTVNNNGGSITAANSAGFAAGKQQPGSPAGQSPQPGQQGQGD
jgi:prepilin-type N-terminal cleavage/methylation domain-containing protein